MGNFNIDMKRGILCSSTDWQKQEDSAAVITLMPSGRRSGVAIDIGFLRDVFRLIYNQSHVITANSSLVGIDSFLAAHVELNIRKDLEVAKIWPMIDLPENSIALRGLSINNLLNVNNNKLGERLSMAMLSSGLRFSKGILTSLMQQPEVVALIEGADFSYPDPRFIRDMSQVGVDGLGKRLPDWFRSNKDLPTLWKGQSCILCDSDRAQVKHIIGISRIVECPNCGLEFDNPQALIDSRQLEKYSSRFDHLRGGVSSRMRADQNASVFIDDINELCPTLKAQSLLDIGCASGEFMYALHVKYSWPIPNLRGIEPSELSARDASEKYGLNVVNLPAEMLSLSPHSVSLATILNSVEHFSEPRLVLRQLYKAIKPGGMLFIGTVPNVNSLPSLLFPEGFIAKNFPDGQHHYQFSPETLSRLCETEGFKVTKLRGRARDIVNNNVDGTARWLAFSCGVPSETLGRLTVMLHNFEKQVRRGQELALRKGNHYRFKVNPNDFRSPSDSLSFWRREIWSSPYLSDTFDIWLSPIK